MKQYKTEKIRNVGLVAHGGAGKTSLAEALLFSAKATDRLGKVDDGTTAMDFDAEEIKRKISISAAVAPCEWKDCKINLVDTPGYFDFTGEVKGALRAVDVAAVVACAVSGVEVGTEKVWKYAEEDGLAKIFFINKMDRENANFYKVFDAAREVFGNSLVPVQLPIGSQDSFKGVVDLIKMKAYTPGEGEIPEDLVDEAATYREMLVDVVAEEDDELMMKYLDGEELTNEEVSSCLKKAIASGKACPVLCGSSLKNIGMANLMDFIVDYLPSPAERPEYKGSLPGSDQEKSRKPASNEPFSALVFKTLADPYVGKLTLFRVVSGSLKSDSHVYNANKGETERLGQIFILKGKNQIAVPQVEAGDIAAVAKLQETATGDTLCEKDNPIVYPEISFPQPSISLAVEPKSKGDEDKIGSGLTRLTEEDPTFEVYKDPITKQTLISGLGELHLEVITSKLHKKFGAEVTLSSPKIPYKETIRSTVKVEGKHKKQSGGRGQYGHVWIEIEPLQPGEGFVFEEKIFGGSVPRQYIPAVEKGIRETLEEGVLAGFPVVDVKVTLYDGSFHPVDSSEMAFKIASSMAFKKGALQAKPALLEPIMDVEVIVPDEYMGDIIGDLNKKRGKILGMEPQGHLQLVKAQAPQAEMFKYATDLRSMTQGRGSFTMTFSHYEEVPGQISETVVEEAKKEREKEDK
jgi:elongation factor G